MKQHTRPIIIQNGEAIPLRKLDLNVQKYNEAWIQQLCFENPHLLPLAELEPTFAGMIPVCKEFSVPSGFIDLVYVNEYGLITIGECKLWRNPDARRKVIGQILDYAKDLSKLNYQQFERQCFKARNDEYNSLFELIQFYHPDIEEAEFIDQVHQSLKKGRFLLTIVGDGIRGNMEDLANYIHMNGNLNFTLGLVEIPVYEHPENGNLVITPRILAKTKEIERIIYRVEDAERIQKDNSLNENNDAKSITETVYFERLEKAIGKAVTDEFKSFLKQLNAEYSLIVTFGRGKRISLNIKTFDEFYNFASVQDDGTVMFFGIVTRTQDLGDQNIGIEYLSRMAKKLNAQIHDRCTKWQWSIKNNGNYINIVEYLDIKEYWNDMISIVLEKLNELRDS